MRISRRERSVINTVAGLIAATLVLALTACSATSARVRSPTPTASQPTPTVTTTSGSGGAATWTVVTSVPRTTVSLRFAPSNPSVAYLCADDGPAVAPLTATSRLYKSVDGGQSWRLVGGAPTLHLMPPAVSGPTHLAGCRVFVDASDAGDVFFQQTEIDPVGASFAVARGLWRSRDGGQTWHQITALDRTDGFDQLAVVGARLVARPHPSVFGSSACDPSVTPKAFSQVLGSDDGGITWHDIGQGVESQGYSPRYFAVAGNILFATADKVPATECGAEPPVTALWRSPDAGQTWAPVATPGTIISLPSFTPKATGSGHYGVASAPVGTSPNEITTFYSTDSGATWTALSVPTNTSAAGFAQLAVAPSGALLLGGRDTDPVFVLYPGSASPAWTLYAPGSAAGSYFYMDWQVVPGPGSTTLWAVGFYYGGPALVEHLPLP